MKHFYLLLLGTFLVGFVIGIYAHVFTREPTSLPEAEQTPEFAIIADEYGGCTLLGCGSYRIDPNGEYTYIARRRGDSDLQFEGILSDSNFDALLDVLDERELARLESSRFEGSCPATVDGVSYRFEIQIGENGYSFDSCKQAISSSAFFKQLITYFATFSSRHGY